jgi:regulator of protease activity HflC (stomatin/prohibitin superfamily)
MPPDSTLLTQADAGTMLMGSQPLDAVLEARGTNNHDVVAAAGGNGLTHKVVQKARKGRQLTARAQKKVLAAVNAAGKLKDFPALKHAEAFNYIGR